MRTRLNRGPIICLLLQKQFSFIANHEKKFLFALMGGLKLPFLSTTLFVFKSVLFVRFLICAVQFSDKYLRRFIIDLGL